MNIVAQQTPHALDGLAVQHDRAPSTWLALIVRAMVFVAVMVTLDRVAGAVLGVVHERIYVGRSVGDVNRALQADAQVLVFGSSRAKRGYVDEELSRQLGVKVFNAGADGRGIQYARALAALIDGSRVPRVVVLDVTYFPGEQGRASPLAPFYGHSRTLDRILVERDWRARVRLTSRAYRFNGLVFSMAQNIGRSSATSWGFVPARGSMNPSTSGTPMTSPPEAPVTESFEDMALGFVEEARARGSEVIFVESPSWAKRLPAGALGAYERVAARKSVPFLRFDLAERPSLANPSLFHDVTHLNESGAHLFSEMIGEELRRYLNRKSLTH